MVKVEHLIKTYGKKQILNDLGFQAKCGEQIAFIGPNGCGKTTLLQILAGVIPPTAGSIFYFGQDALHNKKTFSIFCGYLPQENPLMEDVSVQDNISLWSGKRGRPEQSLIEMFELEEVLKMRVSKLSGGMKRRISIACALVHMPPVLVMDEPTTALDSYYKESIHTWMKEYRKKNGIILLATHDPFEIKESSRCILM